MTTLRKPPQVTVTLRRSWGGEVDTRQVKVDKPTDAATLAAAYRKVLRSVERSEGDVFDEETLAQEMVKAAAGEVRAVRLDSRKGTRIVDVRVEGRLEKTFAKVLNHVEQRIGHDVVDEVDLGEQLAALATTAKLNQTR